MSDPLIPGVVFLDQSNGNSRPVAIIRVASGAPWFYRWSDGNKNWVSLRPCSLWEAVGLKDCLPAEQAALYGIQHDPSIFDPSKMNGAE